MYSSATSDRSQSQIRSAEGKGMSGCMIFIVVLFVAILIGFQIVPDYYSYASFESDVKTEASRAGAHSLDEETIITDILDLARKNEVRLTRENIQVEHLAGQVFITVRYSVPKDFIGYQHKMQFEIKASSYIGRL